MKYTTKELMEIDLDSLTLEELNEIKKGIGKLSELLNRDLWNHYDIMTDEQKKRWKHIMEEEETKLEELEVKYQEEIKTLNERHLIEWQNFYSKPI